MALFLGLTSTAVFLWLIHLYFRKQWAGEKRLLAWAPLRGYRVEGKHVKGEISGFEFTLGRIHRCEFGQNTVSMVLQVKNLPTYPLLEIISRNKIGFRVVHKIWNRPPDYTAGQVQVFSDDPHFLTALMNDGLKDFIDNSFDPRYYVVFHKGVLEVGMVPFVENWHDHEFEVSLAIAKKILEILHTLQRR